MTRLIRLRALDGTPVKVFVYDTVAEMRAAGTKFNGSDHDESWGLTQAWSDQTGRVTQVVIRLCRESLGAEVVGHELHHAATAIYGAGVRDRVSRAAHLNHYNEPFAHLFSNLLGKLNRRLWDLGLYDS